MRGLKGKRVLITGGASGIGAATGARFLEEGSRVCVLDRDERGCERISKELTEIPTLRQAQGERLWDSRRLSRNGN